MNKYIILISLIVCILSLALFSYGIYVYMKGIEMNPPEYKGILFFSLGLLVFMISLFVFVFVSRIRKIIRGTCPECNTLSVGTDYCLNCGYRMIMTCDKCGSNMMIYDKKCKKCK